LVSHLPEALIIGCPETQEGAIAQLPEAVDLSKYSAIACGPGLTPQATDVVEQVVMSDRPLVLDADGLNIVAEHMELLRERTAPTLLTPHPGEFKRLFPNLAKQLDETMPGAVCDRIATVQQAAQQCRHMVLLKGARVAIAHPQGCVWVNPASTPALARGGSGDVLTGLAGGLLAEAVAAKIPEPLERVVPSATWWHAQAAIAAVQERTDRRAQRERRSDGEHADRDRSPLLRADQSQVEHCGSFTPGHTSPSTQERPARAGRCIGIPFQRRTEFSAPRDSLLGRSPLRPKSA